jgi:hypothetical protein
VTDTLGGTNEVRLTPGASPSLLKSIEETLNALPSNTFAVSAWVPRGHDPDGDKVLAGALYLKRPKGWSFSVWGEGELKASGDWGAGFTIRKEFRS